MNKEERTSKFFALHADLVQRFDSCSEIYHNLFTIESNSECKTREDSFKRTAFFFKSTYSDVAKKTISDKPNQTTVMYVEQSINL
jgi:hypothetical protein